MSWYLKTDHPFAKTSPDYIHPLGAIRDNTARQEFNWKLYELFPNKTISVLDLGCAGGGFVHSVLNDGHVAVGLEGSDYNQWAKAKEWGKIPDNLFTCDIAQPFTLNMGGNQPYKFTVITAWEFFEHPAEEEQAQVMDNVMRHLKPGGLLICSISNFRTTWEGYDYHQTIKPEEWWVDHFTSYGLKRRSDLEKYFDGYYVRQVRINLVWEAP